jgi:hypothetical protein
MIANLNSFSLVLCGIAANPYLVPTLSVSASSSTIDTVFFANLCTLLLVWKNLFLFIDPKADPSGVLLNFLSCRSLQEKEKTMYVVRYLFSVMLTVMSVGNLALQTVGNGCFAKVC